MSWHIADLTSVSLEHSPHMFVATLDPPTHTEVQEVAADPPAKCGKNLVQPASER